MAVSCTLAVDDASSSFGPPLIMSASETTPVTELCKKEVGAKPDGRG